MVIPEIQIPSIVVTILQVLVAFTGAFLLALWLSMIVWTFRDARSRSRDIFAILLATLMVVVFGPLGLVLYFLLRPPVTLAELYERSLEEEALLQDIEERPKCPGCSRVANDKWLLCPDCHTQLKKQCPHCENILNLNWKLCPFCATTVEMPPDDYQDPSGQPLAEPERTISTAYPESSPTDETRPHIPQTTQA